MADGPTSQPSSILFFIAVAIGVVIAGVFIFFSLRYYVRTKLGIYATARLSVSPNNGAMLLLSSDLPLHTFSMYNQDYYTHAQDQTRRRRRYLKKRRLTEQEVEHLFPLRTYQDWLDGGAERDLHTRDIAAELKEEDDEAVQVDQQQAESPQQASRETSPGPLDHDHSIANDKPETHSNDTDHESSMSPSNAASHSYGQTQHEVDLGNPYHEIHFDSGSCAICIDAFESEDTVRGLICGHVFHQECLDPWLIKRKACCPMCKRDYYMKNNEDPEDAAENDNESTTQAPDQLPELQFRTLTERVAEILQRNPELEETAKESIKHYLNFKWRFFWFIMGISKQDLINCAIASEDDRLRAEAATAAALTSTASNAAVDGTLADDAHDSSPHTTEARAVELNRQRVESMV